MSHKGLTKKGFFYRTVMTSVASMFGEMGYLSENSTPNLKGLFITTLLIILAFLFLIYIQAKLTTSMIEERINKNVSKLTLARGVILGHEGYALAKRFESLGGNVKFIKFIHLCIARTNCISLLYVNSGSCKSIALISFI